MTDNTLRLAIFLGVFAGLALLELLAPRRIGDLSRRARWPGALILLLVSAVLARLILPIGLAGLAMLADAAGFGLFNLLDVPLWLALLASLLILDFAVWAQHFAMHRFNLLWRFHRVHHTDPALDVTTALRFHPGEIMLSLIWKGALVVLLGVPAFAAFWFEVLLNAFAQFNHANINLPRSVERALRWLIVTPDMHRVHHSTNGVEHNRNFGFCLSLWDRLFRLYKAQPNEGHTQMGLGQTEARSALDQRADHLLLQPLQAKLRESRQSSSI